MSTKNSKNLQHASISIRGARQNNLAGFDIDLLIGKMIVVTGPSGSGKSSFAFDTVYAEGQRRYVETFSPYTRQFFDRMDKPQVDSITNIPPAIALEQNNSVRTSRSTVGTLTEINEHLKLLFPRLAQCWCDHCGRRVQPETPASILDHLLEEGSGASRLLAFEIPVPTKTKPADFFDFVRQQGYLRVWLDKTLLRTDEPPPKGLRLPAVVPVIQDRVVIDVANRSRLTEAIETALRFGKDKIAIIDPATGDRRPFSRGWHCAYCDLDFRPPSPALFSFNHPVGACPGCKGFGRTLSFDPDKAIPDRSLSIKEGCVKAFSGQQYAESQRDLLKAARAAEVDVTIPFFDLPEADQKWVMDGDRAGAGLSLEERWREGLWYGVRGFFEWLESKTYKMHVRVFLSRFRSARPCPTCNGGRFQPESLRYKLNLAGEPLTLPALSAMPVSDLTRAFQTLSAPDEASQTLLSQIRSRLACLNAVDLGYLTLDRTTRTLSGGELQRVNLTACIGANLVNTLFVLDEPTIGLHPRDTQNLARVLLQLRDRGNSLLVVEHEEIIMRAADQIVDIGPDRGESGGRLVYQGALPGLLRNKESLTASYLAGRSRILPPKTRRLGTGALRIRNASANNIQGLNLRIPLGAFVAVTGVSGSGKSSLVHSIIQGAFLRDRGLVGNDDEVVFSGKIEGFDQINELVMVDQSPLTKTPRSTPAVYTGAYEGIRNLFGSEPSAAASGFTASDFSFNTGNGRCGRCNGSGFEKVEMQFLSDVHVRCPECDGRRFTPALLRVRHKDKSVHDVLEMSVREALEFFGGEGGRHEKSIISALKPLADVGLGYLRLGQPLNTLSGGESQRLKLVGHLAARGKANLQRGDLLVFDEPTTGLHFDDIARLVEVFQRLVDEGNSLIVIEHNLDVIQCADHIIDLGPEAGAAGGRVVAEGTPEEIAGAETSVTGRFLRSHVSPGNRPAAGLEAIETGWARVAEEPQLGVVAANTAIEVRGAREHNLKNISLSIPRDQFVVITGLSGSGKSSLAFDLLFAEGQRRFLDSMSPFARQFVEQMEKPDVDQILGLPPSVAIEQRVTRGGGKSTVATVTEVYHFIRLLFSKLGTQYCPACNLPVARQSVTAILTRMEEMVQAGRIRVLAPLVKARKGFHTEVAAWAGKQGFTTLLVDGALVPVAEFKALERFREHTIDAVVGEAARGATSALRQLAERALAIGKGTAKLLDHRNRISVVSTEMSCPGCSRSFEELDPRLFSFNSPHGWCPTCRGFGALWNGDFGKAPDRDEADSLLDAELREERRREWAQDHELEECPDCRGSRLNDVARHVRMGEHNIGEVTRLSVRDCGAIIGRMKFRGRAAEISRDILPEITQRLEFMERVGLGYLHLDRSARTLSGGESQRIRLAAQLGSTLRGVLYVLDEPTIGLHARDNERLLDMLAALKERGNSLVIVEHDEETMKRAGHIIDLGPGAGVNGGRIVAQGSFSDIVKSKDSPTGRYLRSPLRHPLKGVRRAVGEAGWIELKGAKANNLRDVDTAIPIGCLTVVTGVSGSGKSSLVRSTLRPAVEQSLAAREKGARGNGRAGANKKWKSLKGNEKITALCEVDQSPIGKTSRSTPSTYIKVFDHIRELFATLPLSRMRAYTASRFSFNTEGGRCEVCEGHGVVKVEMNFLPTHYIPCEECGGRRFNAQTLEVEYNGRTIGDIMDMTVDEAVEFFAPFQKVSRPLGFLRETGLGYLKLGQPSPTLSGGEAQRIKLVTELARGGGRGLRGLRPGEAVPRGSRLYLLEEPTIGLHMADVEKLIHLLHRLVDEGHTIVVIEHNLSVVAEADHIIDIGPEAGEEGGRIVATGTPEEIARHKTSRTAPFLKSILSTDAHGGHPQPAKPRKATTPRRKNRARELGGE